MINPNQFPQLPILVVDDEEQFRFSVTMTLESAGINNFVECPDSRQVIPLLDKHDFGLILLDISMPFVTGTELLPAINEKHPDIPVIMVTALNELDTAVGCMQTGAFDYLLKPIDHNRLTGAVRRAIEMGEVKNENRRLKEYLLSDKLEKPEAFRSIITENSAMRSIFQYMEAISGTSLPVLVTGETGVGKELFARAVHDLSGRKGEFVAVNIAGVDDNIFSDTLFGHVKGAFTGADRERKGLIEQAAGGTLFLDEIGDLSVESQVKLLRLIQEGTYFPVGSDIKKMTDARIVVATNLEKRELQGSGRFRKDLYYRLQTYHIQIPPLRERKDDLPLLVDHFTGKACEMLKKKRVTPPKELFTLLRSHHFPGNIRELEGILFDAVSRHQSGVLSLAVFKEKIGREGFEGGEIEESWDEEKGKSVTFNDPFPTLKELERLAIEEALLRVEGNQSQAAQLLGINRTALCNRLKRAKEVKGSMEN